MCSEKKTNWLNSIFAGLIGTVFFGLSGWALTSQLWDIPVPLGENPELVAQIVSEDS